MFHGQLGATQWRQLVGVKVDSPAVLPRAGKQAPGLLEAEDSCLAEDVDSFGEASAGDFGVDLVDELLHPAVGIVTALRWHLVRRKAGGMEIDRVPACGLSDDLEHPDLGVEIEPVTGLGLEGGGSVEEKGVEAGEGRNEQLFEARRPGGPHRGVDASARAGDLHVGLAAKAAVELVLPRSRPHWMGVGIDKPGKHATAIGIEHPFGRCKTSVVLGLVADEGDHAIITADDGSLVYLDFCKGAAPSGGAASWSDDLRAAPDEKAHP